VIELAGLDLVQRNDDSLEEDYMFLPERDCKSTDNAGQNIKEFRCSIKLVGFMNQCVERIINSLQLIIKITFLIIFRRGTSLAYNLCKIFFKYSLSLGSSESKSSKNS